MPCSDGIPSVGQISRDYQARIDLNARVACNALNLIEENWPDRLTDLSAETLDWWEDHKQRDKQRLLREQAQQAREQLKTQALAKLSVAERKALGL